MKWFLVQQALNVLSPILIGLVIHPLFDAIKKASTWVDELAPGVKNAVVAVIATALTGLAAALGQDIPTDLSQWNEAFLKTFLAALLPIALKKAQQLEKANKAP